MEASLTAQAALEANAYLVPGFMPDYRDEDLRPCLRANSQDGFRVRDRARPPARVVRWRPDARTRTDGCAHREVPHFVEALYLQLTPIQPVTDSLSKLEQVTTIYRHAASRGFKVIAGHAGAATPALRAFGIDAADAGLATWSPRTRVLRTDRAIP